MRCPHPRLLHSHWEDAPAGLQLHMLLMGSARSCGYCSTMIHHLWAHVERGFSRALFRRKDEFLRRKTEPTENDSKTTVSWQEGLHMQQASPSPKEPLPTGVELSSTSQLQLWKCSQIQWGHLLALFAASVPAAFCSKAHLSLVNCCAPKSSGNTQKQLIRSIQIGMSYFHLSFAM